MKIILLQNIKGLGRIGDIKNVADGYGRNFLLVRKMAKLASEGSRVELEALKKRSEVETKVAQEKAKEIAAKAKDIVLEFTKKASKAGKLFASLTKEEVARELSKAISAKVELDNIDFKEHGEHIKQEGEHLIEVELTPEVKVQIKIIIKSE